MLGWTLGILLGVSIELIAIMRMVRNYKGGEVCFRAISWPNMHFRFCLLALSATDRRTQTGLLLPDFWSSHHSVFTISRFSSPRQ